MGTDEHENFEEVNSVYIWWKKVLFLLSNTFEKPNDNSFEKSIDNNGKEWEC